MGERTLSLKAFRRDNVMLCSTALSDATEDLFEDWIAERLEEVKPNTVGRDLCLLKPIFAAAARTYDLLRSPLEYVKAPRAIDERIRRIDPQEEAVLFGQGLCHNVGRTVPETAPWWDELTSLGPPCLLAV